MIHWDDILSTGNERIDAQHQTLVEKFNELSHVFEGNVNGKMREAAGELLDFLQFYAAWHFNQEEALMENPESTMARVNVKQHAEFLTVFGKFYTQWQVSTMDMDLARKAYSAMEGWITHHILNVDTRLELKD